MHQQGRSHTEYGAIIERIKVQTAPGFGAGKRMSTQISGITWAAHLPFFYGWTYFVLLKPDAAVLSSATRAMFSGKNTVQPLHCHHHHRQHQYTCSAIQIHQTCRVHLTQVFIITNVYWLLSFMPIVRKTLNICFINECCESTLQITGL